MKAYHLLRPGQLEQVEVPAPDPLPGEVVLQVVGAMTCGTDLKTFLRGHPKIPLPTPFGHEYSGIVAKAGKNVHAFAEGDPVMGVHTAPCNDCRPCQRGFENLCTNLFDEVLQGTYAEYVRVPAHVVDRNLFPKPEHLSYEKAAFVEPLACVVHGLSRVPVREEDVVLVIGAGAIGLLHVALLRTLGAGQIIVSGRRSERLATAKVMGASQIIDEENEDVLDRMEEITGGHGADLVIECTGFPSTWEESIQYTAPGGRIILFGGCPSGSTVQFDTERLHYDEITLQGAFHFNPSAVARTRELLIEGSIDPQPLISGSLPLDNLKEAFQRLQNRQGIKYWIRP